MLQALDYSYSKAEMCGGLGRSGVPWCLGCHQGCDQSTCNAEESLGWEQRWSVSCWQPVGNMGLAEGADITAQEFLTWSAKEGRASMWHIFPEPSASPFWMGRSGRFSNQHSFTGVVSLSPGKTLELISSNQWKQRSQNYFPFQQRFALAHFSFTLEDGKKKTGSQVTVYFAVYHRQSFLNPPFLDLCLWSERAFAVFLEAMMEERQLCFSP